MIKKNKTKLHPSAIRIATICELQNKNNKNIQLLLKDDDARIIAKNIAGQVDAFFSDIQSEFEGVMPIEKSTKGLRTIFDVFEAPVVIFPTITIQLSNLLVKCKISTTVCKGHNRSKLWVRISDFDVGNLNEEDENYEIVKRVTKKISQLVFSRYKSIVEKEFNDGALVQVYEVNAFASEFNSSDPVFLEQLRRRERVSLRNVFSNNSDFFDAAANRIFPIHGLNELKITDYEKINFDNYGWVRLQNKGAYDFGVFFKGSIDEKVTEFSGLVVKGDSNVNGIESAPTIFTRNILDLISPRL